MKKLLRMTLFLSMTVGLLLIWGGIVSAQDPTEEPTPEAAPVDDMVARGQYLAGIAGCFTCHTPYITDPSNMTPEQLLQLATSEHDVLDVEHPLSGGRVFPLGPAGFVISRNLTPDEETGLGAWTDEEIKTAIRTGVSRDGRQLHPLMPYRIFNTMAEADLDAIIAYLRSLEPVAKNIPVPTFGLPNLGFTMPEEEIVAPDVSDPAAYGAYLMMSVLPCSDCHTPLDENTGMPLLEMFLGGGQPYEGPWGIVYGSNITPDEETGLGNWTDEELAEVMQHGIRPDGRRLILMPWQDYETLTESDMAALLVYLREEVEPVENEVPAASLNEGFEAIVGE